MYINIGIPIHKGLSKLACLTPRALWCALHPYPPLGGWRVPSAQWRPRRWSTTRRYGFLAGELSAPLFSCRHPPFVSCQSQLWQTVRRRQPARRSASAAAMRVPVRCIPHSVLTRSLSLLQDKTDATKRFVIKQARTHASATVHSAMK